MSREKRAHDGSLSKIRVVRNEVESCLSIDFETDLVRRSLGKSVSSVGEHENVELHLSVED